MSGGIRNIPTYRTGRTRDISSPDDPGSRRCNRVCLSFLGLVFFVVGPLALVWQESRLVLSSDALSEIVRSGKGVDLNLQQRPTPAAFFQTREIDATVRDEELNLEFSHALKAERRTEYCQWEQHHRDVCETCYRDINHGNGNVTRESYSCNCKRTFSYIKAWRPHRINSLIFDQPAAHWNPQDDPFPSISLYSVGARLGEGKFEATHELIRYIKGKSRPIKWTYNGLREPRWYDFATNWFGIQDNSRIETLTPLKEMTSSRAATQSQVVYAGDGYFFRPYQVSVQERLLKALFQYAEGSLLDFQLGDLVPSCEAGDIKFLYYVTDPDVVSGVGAIVSKGGKKVLDVFRSQKTNATIGLLSAGEHTMTELVQSEMWSQWLITIAVRVLCGLPFAYILHFNLLAFLAGPPLISSSYSSSVVSFLVEGLYVASLAAFFVYLSRHLVMRCNSLADTNTALMIAATAIIIYAEGLIRALRSTDKPKGRQGGFSGLWKLWTAAV